MSWWPCGSAEELERFKEKWRDKLRAPTPLMALFEEVQMRCDHRYKLVGYRAWKEDAGVDSTAVILVDKLAAVLVCLKCTREHLIEVTEIPPAPIIQAAPIGSAEEPE